MMKTSNFAAGLVLICGLGGCSAAFGYKGEPDPAPPMTVEHATDFPLSPKCRGVDVKDERGRTLHTHSELVLQLKQDAPAVFGSHKCPQGTRLWLGGDHSRYQDIAVCISTDKHRLERMIVRTQKWQPREVKNAASSLSAVPPVYMSGVQCWINADEELQPEEKTTANGECLPVHAILASRSSGDYAEICAGHGGKVEIAGEIRLAFDGGEDARDRSGNNP